MLKNSGLGKALGHLFQVPSGAAVVEHGPCCHKQMQGSISLSSATGTA